jgi:hypothetical protein
MERTGHVDEDLTEAQLDGCACIHCGDKYSDKRPVVAWTDHCARIIECVDVETCARRISPLRLLGIGVTSAGAE